MAKKPKVILFDLETIPNWNEALKVWPQLSNYPGLTLKATISTIICAGWKELGEKQTHCINAWDFSRWDRNINDDFSVVKAISNVLADADAVVTHNGKRFDWRFLQTRIVFHKLPPLPKITHIDTCQEAKKNLYTFNNKLNTLAALIKSGKKLNHGEGWNLWVKVANKDEKAMRLMAEYCKQDVRVLEKVFNELKPFIGNIPNHNLFVNDEKRVCPNCGGKRLKSHGWRHTKTKSYRRLRCRECHTISRVDKRGRMPRTL